MDSRKKKCNLALEKNTHTQKANWTELCELCERQHLGQQNNNFEDGEKSADRMKMKIEIRGEQRPGMNRWMRMAGKCLEGDDGPRPSTTWWWTHSAGRSAEYFTQVYTMYGMYDSWGCLRGDWSDARQRLLEAIYPHLMVAVTKLVWNSTNA